MWYPVKITAIDSEPITIDEVKAQCLVDSDDDDAELENLIAAARDHVERYCNIRLATQTVEVKCDSFADMERLPVAPAQSVTSIEFRDTAGATQTVSADVYEERFDDLEAAIVLKYGQRWPAIQPGSRITLTAVVGYEAVPPAVKVAMLVFIADSYNQRENAKAEDWTALDYLLCNFRRGA
jgi:uncharacterized phiE125 gp8 family phage protein